jgi:hypothetical protein
VAAGAKNRGPHAEVLERHVAECNNSHEAMLSVPPERAVPGTKGLGADLGTMPDSEVRFDPRATAKNRWDSFPFNCIWNILIPSIRTVSGDLSRIPPGALRQRSSVRSDKPSHVTSPVFGPSHEGDERDYAQSLTCCF